jgi:hypothetical protein
MLVEIRGVPPLGEGQERREIRYSKRVGIGGESWCACVSAIVCFLVIFCDSSSIKIRHVFRVLSKKR